MRTQDATMFTVLALVLLCVALSGINYPDRPAPPLLGPQINELATDSSVMAMLDVDPRGLARLGTSRSLHLRISNNHRLEVGRATQIYLAARHIGRPHIRLPTWT